LNEIWGGINWSALGEINDSLAMGSSFLPIWRKGIPRKIREFYLCLLTRLQVFFESAEALDDLCQLFQLLPLLQVSLARQRIRH
jgi:hypothetical protein